MLGTDVLGPNPDPSLKKGREKVRPRRLVRRTRNRQSESSSNSEAQRMKRFSSIGGWKEVAVLAQALADLLLLLIRDVRDFQFNKVVSLDVLLTVHAHGQPIISKKITSLLMLSYFPTKVSIEEARFCEFAASEGASLKSIMELVRALINLVSSSAKLDANYIDGLILSAKYLCGCISSEPCYKMDLKDLFTAEKLKCLVSVAESGRARSSLFNIVS
ncbi:hypothetical protein SDJN03_04739, partial [Cucurbita argyrosperma subsp. sororia]